ncbi:hypothetical protein ZEAMMB73_Zm00001d007498 [Zea mays]|uniref:Uncharacterized protein n=1 Tax=Zea mays TaxID=4577 RepID=A0A1D6F6S0_MAIZE|nr:hypothetical protein ZEAMMB73_Zm00001d007498 [Zea mays]
MWSADEVPSGDLGNGDPGVEPDLVPSRREDHLSSPKCGCSLISASVQPDLGIVPAENARPTGRWPAAKPKASDLLAHSLDCSLDRKDSILAAIHLLRRSMAFDSTTSLSSSDPAAPDLYASSDTDIVSSGSNSVASDPPRQGISVPASGRSDFGSRSRCITLGEFCLLQKNTDKLDLRRRVHMAIDIMSTVYLSIKFFEIAGQIND